MRIAFDHQIFCLQKTGGIARYFSCLLTELCQLDQTPMAFAPVYRNSYLTKSQRQSVRGLHVSDYLPKTAGAMVALNGMLSRPMIRSWQPDIVHETYFSSHRRVIVDKPLVLTMFDMIPELGDLSQLQSPKAKQTDRLRHTDKYRAVARADHVVCISEQTRQDLLQLYDVAPAKVSVIHLGCDVLSSQGLVDLADESLTARASRRDRPYLLYVGLRQGYKNFSAFLTAVARSMPLRKTFDIVAFGGGDFDQDEQAQIQCLGFEDQQVTQLSGPDDRLARLYQNAAALVYPSLYEGFGLPPLEAMSLRCPVVCSNTSSIPEIVGDAGAYFDPRDPTDMATKIEQVVSSTALRQQLIESGEQRARQFTWRRCAEQHLQTYRQLAGD